MCIESHGPSSNNEESECSVALSVYGTFKCTVAVPVNTMLMILFPYGPKMIESFRVSGLVQEPNSIIERNKKIYIYSIYNKLHAIPC